MSIFISKEKIEQMVNIIACEINQYHKNEKINSVTLVGAMKACIPFMVGLSQQLVVPSTWEFADINTYKGVTKGNKYASIKYHSDMKNIIIVDTILDTGETLECLYEFFSLESKQLDSIQTCALIKKKRDCVFNELNYCGDVINDEFVVGYGLDYYQYYRNLDIICDLDYAQRRWPIQHLIGKDCD